MEEFLMQEMEARIQDHRYYRMYIISCDYVEKLSENTEKDLTVKKFLEQTGNEFFADKEYEKAFVMYRTCAEYCDSVISQLRLGHMFMDGTGVEKNLVKAYYWFFKASKNEAEGAEDMCNKILQDTASAEDPLVDDLYKNDNNTALSREEKNLWFFFLKLSCHCICDKNKIPFDLEAANFFKKKCDLYSERYKAGQR